MKIINGISYTLNVFIILLFFWIFLEPKPELEEIKVGDTYLFSLQWEKENPFEEVKIDTVKVLNIKNDYVQYKFNWAKNPSSTKLKYFKQSIKPIKK
jgi:hypothetical protein